MPPKSMINNDIITYYINIHNLTKEQTIQCINDYIQEECHKQNKSYYFIYNEAITNKPDIMKYKFYYEPYGWISKTIKDADLINADPDHYVINHLSKLEDLKRMVDIASYLYYNDVNPLDDNAFDCIEYHLKKRLKLKNRLYNKIGAPPIDKIKTKLPYNMPSLEKIKPGTTQCSSFISSIKNLLWSQKLDGVSCMSIYKHGKLSNLYTRGDGVMGGNITPLSSFLNIPQKITHKGILVVRGELILPKDKWDKYNKDYTNARSFVNAQTNTNIVSPYLGDIDFVAYEMMSNNNQMLKPSIGLQQLTNFGFKVVKYGIIEQPTLYQIMQLYIIQRQESLYVIDGLVLTEDEERLACQPLKDDVVTSPTHTYAFKMNLDEQIRSTEVLNVEWNISRYGRFVPVVVYKSVYIDGVRMHRATGHNAKHIKDWSMGTGTKITVIRSGDVIPYIKNVDIDKTIQPIYPSQDIKWHWDGLNIVLDDIDNNTQVQMNRILFFFKTIGLTNFGEKTVEKFYQHGLTTPELIIKAKINDFMKIKGIGKKKAEHYYNTIRHILHTCPPDRFIVASSTYQNKFISRSLLKLLMSKIPNILDLNEQQIKDYFKKNKIPGFGPVKIKTVSTNIPLIRGYLDSFMKDDLIKSLAFYHQQKEETKEKGYNNQIKNQKFVLTGFINDNYDFEDYIYHHQGQFSDKVTSDVTAIINGNAKDISKKMIEGSNLKIPVYTLDEFIIKFNISISAKAA
jgi:DNA ligase (NAD+)